MGSAQATLFAGARVGFDAALRNLRRIELDAAAWVDHAPGWLDGHDEVFEALREGLTWRSGERTMYDRVVAVPRLFARVPEDGAGHRILGELAQVLGERYGAPFPFVSCNLYRDGTDSVAPHADHLPAENRLDPLAIVSVGEPRPFVLRPKAAAAKSGARSRTFQLGWGDLLVLGGTAHVDWLHAVPKVARAGARISIMFRRGYEADGDRGAALGSIGSRESL